MLLALGAAALGARRGGGRRGAVLGVGIVAGVDRCTTASTMPAPSVASRQANFSGGIEGGGFDAPVNAGRRGVSGLLPALTAYIAVNAGQAAALLRLPALTGAQSNPPLSMPAVDVRGRWLSPQTAISAAMTAGVAPPPNLAELVPRIAPRPLFLIHSGIATERLNELYHRIAGEPKTLWEIPGAGHTGGLDARPDEYERRVVGFFDEALLR